MKEKRDEVEENRRMQKCSKQQVEVEAGEGGGNFPENQVMI